MVACLWTRIEIRKWQQGICRVIQRHRHGAEISVSAAHPGWGGVSKYCTARILADGSSNPIQCEAAFLDFSLTAGSSEGDVRSLSM